MSSDMLSTVKMPAWRTAVNANATAERKEPVTHRTDEATAAPVAAEAVRNAARQIESYMKDAGRKLEFRVDEASGQMVVSVRDATTGDLIRQIPGEAALRLARQLTEGSGDSLSLLNLKV